jgi:CO/xanthine dehydrogenase Mo-binding subunit
VTPLREEIVASTKSWASIGEGKTHVKGAADCVVTKALPSSRLPRIIVHGTFSFPYPDDLPGELGPGIPHHIFCYGAQVAAVEVDRELGTVHVKDMVAIHDIGRAINPPAAEGQIEGGVGQGIGYALYEQLRRREDGTWIDSFAEYLLPTALDVPHIGAELIEYPEAPGSFGTKGTGEQGTVATASAIANAMAVATGVRVTRLPVEPEDLVRRTTPLE